MNNRVMALIIVLVLLFLSAGCSKNAPTASTPPDTASQAQIDNSAVSNENNDVLSGPAIQEIYDSNQPQQSNQMVYITTDPGLNYHRLGCKVLAKGKIALSVDEAQEDGYTACPICKPPK
jgi:hypothetical protein